MLWEFAREIESAVSVIKFTYAAELCRSAEPVEQKAKLVRESGVNWETVYQYLKED